MPRNNWVDNTTPITAATLNAMVVMDTTEGATNDSVSTANDFTSNANRMRYQLAQIFGGAWNAAVQMLPLSQKGAASGVATLDANTNLVVPSGHKVAAPGQTGGPTGAATVANQVVGAATIANGTTHGSTTTYSNSLITTASHIFVQPRNTGGGSSFLAYCPIQAQAAGSVTFYNMTNGGAALNSANDVSVLIVN